MKANLGRLAVFALCLLAGVGMRLALERKGLPGGGRSAQGAVETASSARGDGSLIPRLHPVVRKEGVPPLLDQLRWDPYLEPEDAALAALAGELDPADPATPARLDAVVAPKIRGRLWKAYLAARADGMELGEIVDLAYSARTGSWPDQFGVVLREIRRRDPDGLIFSRPGSEPFLKVDYIDFAAGAAQSFDEALLALPVADRGIRETQLRALGEWLSHHPSPENLAQMIQHYGDDAVRGLNGYGYPAGVWAQSGSSEDRRKVVETFTTFSEPVRNRGLEYLAGLDGPISAGDVALLLNGMTSYDTQQRVAKKWLARPGSDQAQLLETLSTLPDGSNVRKLATRLGEAPQ